MAEIVRQLRPSVVLILTSVLGEPGISASGSGLIYSEDGLIITNNHVIAGATEIKVGLQREEGAEFESYRADLLGTDPSRDLAVLRIEADDLAAAVLGSSDDLSVGERVVALGYPLFGDVFEELTVTEGIVSRKVRDGDIRAIQHQAPMNPGNSGGPLVGPDGTVVGINTFVIREIRGMSVEGLNFAIAAEEVVSRLRALESGVSLGTALMSRQISPEGYPITFTLPPGWVVLQDKENFIQAASMVTGAVFTLFVDSLANRYASPAEWVDAYTDSIIESVDSYALIDLSYGVDEFDNVFYRFIEKSELGGVTYISVRMQSYTAVGGTTVVVQAPEIFFRRALPEFRQISDSLKLK